MNEFKTTHRATPCRCGHKACKSWHVDPVAAVQGVSFTKEQAEEVAALLNGDFLEEGVDVLRMRYAGLLGLLTECSPYVPEEIRESIEVAAEQAASTGRFQYRRILNRIEIEVAS